MLSGHRIDATGWYHRVFAEATMATLNPPHEDLAGEMATRDIGNVMIDQQLHRRLWVEALDEAMKLGLERPQPPPMPCSPTERLTP